MQQECPFCFSKLFVPNGQTEQGHSIFHCMNCGGDFEAVSGDPVFSDGDMQPDDEDFSDVHLPPDFVDDDDLYRPNDDIESDEYEYPYTDDADLEDDNL